MSTDERGQCCARDWERASGRAFEAAVGRQVETLGSCSLQVPARTDCVMFFGPVVPDGYGVCYNPMESHMNVSVSAYNSCAETNAARMAHYLEKALLDMRELLRRHPQAKL